MKTILPWLLWFGIVVSMIVFALTLSGCAQAPIFDSVCGVQPLGTDESNVAYFRFVCSPAK